MCTQHTFRTLLTLISYSCRTSEISTSKKYDVLVKAHPWHSKWSNSYIRMLAIASNDIELIFRYANFSIHHNKSGSTCEPISQKNIKVKFPNTIEKYYIYLVMMVFEKRTQLEQHSKKRDVAKQNASATRIKLAKHCTNKLRRMHTVKKAVQCAFNSSTWKNIHKEMSVFINSPKTLSHFC